MAAYAHAKLAMVMGTYHLARHLEGTGVTVNALHPGLVATGILRGFGIPRPLQPLLTRASRPFLATPEDGARTAIQLATSPDLPPQLDKAMRELQANVIAFDMTNLAFISSAGLRVIFSAAKRQR